MFPAPAESPRPEFPARVFWRQPRAPRLGRPAAHATLHDFWPELAARVGKGKRTTKEEEENGVVGLMPSEAEKRNMHTALTCGMRVGVMPGIRHDALFARRRTAEGQKDGAATRDGAWGCAACMAARMQGTPGQWRQQRRRRAQNTRVATGVTSNGGVCDTNPFAALPVEEPTVHMETIRHVMTECQATAGLRPLADQMAKQCRSASAAVAGERAGGHAREFVDGARQGWEAVARGEAPDDERWRAMQALVGGIMPVWQKSSGSAAAMRHGAANVAGYVQEMQGLVHERVVAHRNRASRVTQWIKDRENERPLMRVLVCAWAEHTRLMCEKRRRGEAVNDTREPLTGTEWKKWRDRESPSDRRARRIEESIKFLRFASLAHAKVTRRERARERLARCLRRSLRQRLVAARWQRAGRRVAGRALIARAKQGRGRVHRDSTVLNTVWGEYRPARARRQTRLHDRPTRTRRPHLTRAAVTGRVAVAVLTRYENLGVG